MFQKVLQTSCPTVRRLSCGALALSLMLLSNVAWSEIYRWVDENGRVHFSDRVPPPVSKLERHVLDEQGNLRDVLSRQRTVEELAQHRQRLQEMASEALRRESQEKYDRYLWTTFSDVQEITDLRSERLEIRDNQIARLQEQHDDVLLALENARKATTRGGSAMAQQNLAHSLETDLQRLQKRMASLREKRQQEFAGLSQDMKRYEFLHLRYSMYGKP